MGNAGANDRALMLTAYVAESQTRSTVSARSEEMRRQITRSQKFVVKYRSCANLFCKYV